MASEEAQKTAIKFREGMFQGDPEKMDEILAVVLDTVKALSRTTDPREMVTIFAERVGGIVPRDHTMTLTRRGLEPPQYRIARCSRWEDAPDPWTERERLPVLEGGILGDLVFGDEPALLDDVHVQEDDPAYDVLHDIRSIMALPNYDGGKSLNMMLLLSHEVGGFDKTVLPEMVWTVNLFGRAIHNLRVGEDLQRAYEIIDGEMKVVSDLQHSLLPKQLPDIPTLDLAAHYQTARQAGGDYYDFFPLADGRWGILIADVCGHGPAAAVLMAITHSLFHTSSEPLDRPAEVLERVNRQLVRNYTSDSRTFVTAFYGVYDPATRILIYSGAGHDPPRVCGDDSFSVLDDAQGMPLGISEDTKYTETQFSLKPGNRVVLYTDGITEAHAPDGPLFGTERLDAILCGASPVASELMRAILDAVEEFTGGAPPHDDRTLLIASVS